MALCLGKFKNRSSQGGWSVWIGAWLILGAMAAWTFADLGGRRAVVLFRIL